MLELRRRMLIGKNWASVYHQPARTGFDGIRLAPIFRVKYRGRDIQGPTERKALSNVLGQVNVRG